MTMLSCNCRFLFLKLKAIKYIKHLLLRAPTDVPDWKVPVVTGLDYNKYRDNVKVGGIGFLNFMMT